MLEDTGTLAFGRDAPLAPKGSAVAPRRLFIYSTGVEPHCPASIMSGLDFHLLVSCSLTPDSTAQDALLGWPQMKGDSDIHSRRSQILPQSPLLVEC